jgi:sialidase-1
MPQIEYLEQHTIYDNPKPHVHSRHGYFPGIARLASGELICLHTIAEAFEAPNSTTWISRSTDNGKTWQLQGVLYDKSVVGFETSDYFKPAALRDGSVIAIGYRYHRHDLESPIAIPETGGLLAGDDVVSFSWDAGRIWSVPQVLTTPYPELLELSGPAIELTSGDLAAVGTPLPMPDGANPSGHVGVLLRSHDRGRTWNSGATYFEMNQQSVTPFESRICEMQPGRLIAIVWAYDNVHSEHLPNQVVVSHDDGRTWSAPINTGHMGQASNLLWLGGDHLLTIHAHRGDTPGIYVRLIDFSGDEWKAHAESVIYGAGAPSQTHASQPIAEMFKSLRFGQPSLVQLEGGEFLAAHWCIEDGQGKIRAHRLRMSI